MCGILSEFVEAKGDTAKKPKTDKQHFRVRIRNADMKRGKRNNKSCIIQGNINDFK